METWYEDYDRLFLGARTWKDAFWLEDAMATDDSAAAASDDVATGGCIVYAEHSGGGLWNGQSLAHVSMITSSHANANDNWAGLEEFLGLHPLPQASETASQHWPSVLPDQSHSQYQCDVTREQLLHQDFTLPTLIADYKHAAAAYHSSSAEDVTHVHAATTVQQATNRPPTFGSMSTNPNFNPPAQPIIVCPTIASIPPGRQAGKVLQCGVAGCTSTQLFDRKYEMQRHLQGHAGRQYPCTVLGCDRIGSKAFARADKRNEHMRKMHGA